MVILPTAFPAPLPLTVFQTCCLPDFSLGPPRLLSLHLLWPARTAASPDSNLTSTLTDFISPQISAYQRGSPRPKCLQQHLDLCSPQGTSLPPDVCYFSPWHLSLNTFTPTCVLCLLQRCQVYEGRILLTAASQGPVNDWHHHLWNKLWNSIICGINGTF